MLEFIIGFSWLVFLISMVVISIKKELEFPIMLVVYCIIGFTIVDLIETRGSQTHIPGEAIEKRDSQTHIPREAIEKSKPIICLTSEDGKTYIEIKDPELIKLGNSVYVKDKVLRVFYLVSHCRVIPKN